MNTITIAGSLGKDAEIRFLPNGDPVCNFSVADSQGKDRPTIWWNCALFGKRAESLSQYLTKGQAVTIAGQVTERAYTDKDGQQRKSIDVRVNDIALQGGKREQSSDAPATRPSRQPAAKPAASNFDGMDDSDIPF